MKHWKFAIAAATLVTLSAPAAAQVTGYAGTEFVEAVRKSDGDKVTQLLRDHPTGLVDARDGDGNTALIIAINARHKVQAGIKITGL